MNCERVVLALAAGAFDFPLFTTPAAAFVAARVIGFADRKRRKRLV